MKNNTINVKRFWRINILNYTNSCWNMNKVLKTFSNFTIMHMIKIESKYLWNKNSSEIYQIFEILENLKNFSTFLEFNRIGQKILKKPPSPLNFNRNRLILPGQRRTVCQTPALLPSRVTTWNLVSIPDPYPSQFVGDICSSKPQKGGTRFFMNFVSPGSPKWPRPPFWALWRFWKNRL